MSKKLDLWNDLKNDNDDSLKPDKESNEIDKKNQKKTKKKDSKPEEKIVYKNKPKFTVDNKSKFSLIFTSTVILILLFLIMIPVLILILFSSVFIKDNNDILKGNGFTKETEFVIVHQETKQEIKNPSYYGEQLILTSNLDEKPFTFNDFSFTNDSRDIEKNQKDGILIESQNYYASSKMVISSLNGNPSWITEKDITKDKALYLEKKSNDEDLFGIKFKENGKFLAKDDNTNQLVFSSSPDWFYFVSTNLNIIDTSDGYIDDYNILHFGQNLESASIGVNGKPISIKSLKTGKYINSYGGLSLSKNSDTNWFIPDQYYLYLSSYRTLPLIKINENKYYPLLTTDSENGLIFKQYDFDDSYINTDYSKIKLIGSPLNFWKKAIYIGDEFSGGFLTTTNDKVSIVEKSYYIENKLFPEFFEITQSEDNNPEFFTSSLIFDSPSFSVINLKTEFFESVNEFSINYYGIDISFIKDEKIELSQKDSSFIEDMIYDSGRITKKVSGPNTKFYLNKLQPNLTYLGTVEMKRDSYGVGKHKTIKIMPFLFGNKISIGDCGDSEYTLNSMWNSTESGHVPSTEYLPNPSEPKHGIDIEKSDRNAEISFQFKNGQNKDFVNEISAKAENMDDEAQPEIYSNEKIYIPSAYSLEEYHLTFSNLIPETNYKITLLFDNKEIEQMSEINYDVGKSQILLKTERSYPIVEKSFVSKNENPSNPYISWNIEISNWKPEDEFLILTYEEGNILATLDYYEFETDSNWISQSTYGGIVSGEGESDGNWRLNDYMNVPTSVIEGNYNFVLFYNVFNYDSWIDDSKEEGDDYWDNQIDDFIELGLDYLDLIRDPNHKVVLYQTNI